MNSSEHSADIRFLLFRHFINLLMQIFRIHPVVLIFVLANCGEKKETSSIPVKQDTAKTIFFPVTEFIKGRLVELDSLQLAPLKIVTENGKADSFWLKRNDIRSFAQPFLTPEIDSAHLSKFFTSTSFLDQTINAFTFSYDPIGQLPDSMALRRWDVYVDPEKNTVKRVFIIKHVDGVDMQLTWTTDWCQIITIKEDKVVREEKMVWGF